MNKNEIKNREFETRMMHCGLMAEIIAYRSCNDMVAMDSGPTIPDWKTETGRFLTELQQIFRIVRYAAALMITTKVMIVAMNQGIAVATVKLSQRKSFLNSSMSLRKPRMSTSNLSNGFILLRHSFGCVFFLCFILLM